jgi:hypothetical protein
LSAAIRPAQHEIYRLRVVASIYMLAEEVKCRVFQQTARVLGLKYVLHFRAQGLMFGSWFLEVQRKDYVGHEI